MTTERDQPAGGTERLPIVPADLRMGDRVTVEAVFVDFGHGHQSHLVKLDIPQCGYRILIPPEGIATHTPKPRPLAVGDTVLVLEPLGGDYPRCRIRCVIIAIHGPLAWVEGVISPMPSFVTEVSKLEREEPFAPASHGAGR